LATIQQVAGAAGTAIFVAFLAIGSGGAAAELGNVAPGAIDTAAIAAGVRLAFLVGAIVSLAALVLAFFVRKPPAAEIPESEFADAREVPVAP
jgi:DHA2 family lincomycin resistance protein-like MFS transporter